MGFLFWSLNYPFNKHHHTSGRAVIMHLKHGITSKGCMIPYEGGTLTGGRPHISDGSIIPMKGDMATYFWKSAFLDGGSIPLEG